MALRRFFARLTASVLGRQGDDRLRDELEEHLTLLTDGFVARARRRSSMSRRWLVVAVAGAAALIPAVRASRLDPLAALRIR